MGKKRKIITAASTTAAAVVGVNIVNRIVFFYSTLKGRLSCSQDTFYEWRFGSVYYTKQGEGTPLLLLHHLSFASSSYEWKDIIENLSQNHTVYTIDLLGCGRSEKPKLTYTNYLYVQLVNDFVKEIIKGKTDVITSGNASDIAAMACMMEPSIYNRLMFIHPDRISETMKHPKANHRALKYLMEVPVIGTLVYNIIGSKYLIRKELVRIGFGNKSCIDDEMISIFNEAAHLGGASARYVYASVRSHFTDIYMGNAVKQLDHSIYVVGSDEKDSMLAMEEYVELNPAVETAVIHGTKLFIHMEKPDELLELCQLFLN